MTSAGSASLEGTSASASYADSMVHHFDEDLKQPRSFTASVIGSSSADIHNACPDSTPPDCEFARISEISRLQESLYGPGGQGEAEDADSDPWLDNIQVEHGSDEAVLQQANVFAVSMRGPCTYNRFGAHPLPVRPPSPVADVHASHHQSGQRRVQIDPCLNAWSGFRLDRATRRPPQWLALQLDAHGFTFDFECRRWCRGMVDLLLKRGSVANYSWSYCLLYGVTLH